MSSGSPPVTSLPSQPLPRPECSASSFFRRRPLFWLSICFCGGIACDALAEPPLPVLCGLAALALAAAALSLLTMRLVWRASRPAPAHEGALLTLARFIQHGAMLCGLAVAFAGGMVVGALRWRIPVSDDVLRLTPAQPAYMLLRGTVVEVSRSRVADTPLKYALPVKWTIDVQSLGAGEASLRPASGRVYLKAPLPAVAGSTSVAGRAAQLSTSVGEGDAVELRARLDPLPEMTLPEGFDYGAHLRRQGIRRVGVVLPGSLKLLAGPRWWRVGLLLRRGSAALAERVEELLPKEEAAGRSAGSQAALLNAFVLGRRERLDSGDREAFSLVGTAHLLVISGLQIHFLAVALWWLCGLLGMKRRTAAWLVVLSCCAYCALAGAHAPVMRATIMIVMYLAAVICWREPDPLSTLGAAALLILFFSPGELFGAGFQLSFLAVLALLTLCPVLNDAWLQWRRRAAAFVASGLDTTEEPPAPGTWRERGRRFVFQWLPGFARRALFVSLAAWVGTAPVVAWHMGRFSAWSLLVNFVAVPLSSVCMLSGLTLLFLSAVSGALAWCAGWVAWASVAALQWVNATVAALPGSSIDVPRPAVLVLLAYAALWIWVWVERGRRATLWRTLAALVTCLFLLNAGALLPRAAAVPSVTVLDLRYGRAALIETSKGAALIDCGAASDALAVAELLRRRGTARLELLVVSEDQPEAIGGARELVGHLPVARVVLPRAGSASTARRELEQVLSRNGTPYGTPWDLSASASGPDTPRSAVVRMPVGELCMAFCDDGSLPERPASVESALFTRVELPGVALLFACARSGVALRRLFAKAGETPALSNGGEEFLRADVLRVSAGRGGRWPAELRELVAQAGCSCVIAGQGSSPEELAGLDLADLAKTEGAVLLSPHRDGTLRVLSAPAARVGRPCYVLQAFRGGAWQDTLDFGF